MRPREISYSIGTNTKYKILQGNNITKENAKSNRAQLEEYISSNYPKNEPDSIEPTYNIPLPPPAPENNKKIVAKGKFLKFHEKASIVNFNKNDIVEISSQNQIKFSTLMAMFDEEELKNSNIELEEIFGTSKENLEDLKSKTLEIFNKVKNAKGEGIKEAKSVLKEKINQISSNIESLGELKNNVDKIDSIIYGENEVKVIYK
jgi:hypothetical protein